VPVYGILCDGDAFEFFLFEGNTDPFSFKRGSRPDHPSLRSFWLPNPSDMPTTRPFIDALRPLCEVIFDLLMSVYVSSLTMYHARSVSGSTNGRQPKNSLGQWEEAICLAVRASEDFREAERKRQTQLTDEANSLVDQAMASLKLRYEIPTFSGITSNQLSSDDVVWMEFRFTNQNCL
jgi:hypothetical protein